MKKQDVQIKDICLYGMYISEMEDQIRKKQEQLKLLQQQEDCLLYTSDAADE